MIARELLDPVLVGGRLGQKLQLGRHGPGEEVDEAFELDLVEWAVAGPLSLDRVLDPPGGLGEVIAVEAPRA